MNQAVAKILEEKGGAIETVGPQAQVIEAVQKMNERRIGSLLVIEDGRPVGIFTERDVLTRVVARRLDPNKTPVIEVMTRQLVTISPTATVHEAMRVITDTRCRHLPVIAPDGSIAGMVSIGDLTRWVVRDQQQTIDDLNDYVRRT
jgi:CBS domain-containing protein